MKITHEVYCKNDFEFWSGAEDTVIALSDEQFETVLSILEELYPEGLDETGLNDFFWFETDTIAEWLGYSSWEELEEDE